MYRDYNYNYNHNTNNTSSKNKNFYRGEKQMASLLEITTVITIAVATATAGVMLIYRVFEPVVKALSF